MAGHRGPQTSPLPWHEPGAFSCPRLLTGAHISQWVSFTSPYLFSPFLSFGVSLRADGLGRCHPGSANSHLWRMRLSFPLHGRFLSTYLFRTHPDGPESGRTPGELSLQAESRLVGRKGPNSGCSPPQGACVKYQTSSHEWKSPCALPFPTYKFPDRKSWRFLKTHHRPGIVLNHLGMLSLLGGNFLQIEWSPNGALKAMARSMGPGIRG